MALIICPQCGKQFSGHAKECPKCGCFALESNRSRIVFSIVGIVLLIISLINLVLSIYIHSHTVIPFYKFCMFWEMYMEELIHFLIYAYMSAFLLHQFRIASSKNPSFGLITLLGAILSGLCAMLCLLILCLPISGVSRLCLTISGVSMPILDIMLIVLSIVYGIIVITYGIKLFKPMNVFAMICGLFVCVPSGAILLAIFTSWNLVGDGDLLLVFDKLRLILIILFVLLFFNYNQLLKKYLIKLGH